MQFSKRWEHFSHGADIGVRGYGTTVTEAFEMAALALTAIITDPANINSTMGVFVSCTAPDLELLLVDWLNAIIYETDVRGILFAKFELAIDKVTQENLELTAVISGELINLEKHQPAVDLKGATYTELKVMQQNGFWVAQCVIDV